MNLGIIDWSTYNEHGLTVRERERERERERDGDGISVEALQWNLLHKREY